MKVLIALLNDIKSNDVSLFLKKEGFTVDSVTSSTSASERATLFDYDCIILDHDFFLNQTFSLIEQISGRNKMEGVIILSTDLTSEAKVQALNAGADDVLMKPLYLPELAARIRAVIRRKKFQSKSKIYFGNLIIDILTNSVFVWSNPIVLTKKEFEILLYLISNKSKVVSKVTLAEYLWGESADNLDTYDALFTHIKNLRKKLKEAKAEVEFKSFYGVGYQIIEI